MQRDLALAGAQAQSAAASGVNALCNTIHTQVPAPTSTSRSSERAATDNIVHTYRNKLRVDESQNMCNFGSEGVGGKGIGKGSHDRYVGKSGIEGLGLSGVGGLGTFGIGGSETFGIGGSGCVGVGGQGVVESESSGIGGEESSGIGGEALTEGHVGRIVSRFEVMALMQLCEHGSSHGSSVCDRQQSHDVDDILKSLTNNHDQLQRHYQHLIDNNHDQQQDKDLKQTMTIDDDDLQRRPTTNNNDATTDSNKQPYGDVHPSQASCGANEPRPKCSRVSNPSPLSKVRGRVGGALNYTDGTLRQGDRQFLVPSTDGGRASNGPKAVVNVAVAGSSSLTTPWPLLPKTRTQYCPQGDKDKEREGNPTAGQTFVTPRLESSVGCPQ